MAFAAPSLPFTLLNKSQKKLRGYKITKPIAGIQNNQNLCIEPQQRGRLYKAGTTLSITIKL